MLNQIVLVGRITKELEVKELENNKKVATMNIAIPRSFKNADGEYETDFINIKVWDGIATNVSEYCKKGDIVVVKGRIQSIVEENALGEKENGEREYIMEVIAEKVTFLSSKPRESEEE